MGVVSKFLFCCVRLKFPESRRADTPMSLRESEAIVLQSYPLGEADRIVSFLSRTMGRMRGVAAGARRPKSRFGSTLERLSHIHIWFFERETRDLVRINQSELIESFLDTHKDYASGVALSLISEVTEAVLPEREASDPAFRLLLTTAKTIKRTGKTTLPLAYFSLWTVRLGGWLPSLDRCGRCGRELHGEPAYASRERAGIVCAQCRLPAMRAISAPALALASRMLMERQDELTKGDQPERPMQELTSYLLDVIEHQIERRLKTRPMLELTA